MKTSPPAVSFISMYTKFDDVYVRESKGRYTNLRWFFVWLTQAVFFGLPWLSWDERQAVLFDLGARKFFLFGLVLFPQDLIYLAVLLIICAYSLFLFTAVSGRVWCGFSCPQTVYTEIFMWIENKTEGSRSARMRMAKQGLTAEKLRKRSLKHLLWLTFAGWTGLSFVAYFIPAHSLLADIQAGRLGPWQCFWIAFYGLATYLNAGFMREQICRYLCPYARFQGSMLDQDTLIVSYDQQRGEPRQGWSAKEKQSSERQGSCIDCSLCVQVCPTGIDIRNGLQHDCIGCAACIDACDSVMDKIQAPGGLVRFTTARALLNGEGSEAILRRIWRPRVVIYSLILGLIVSAFSYALFTRSDLRMNVIRDRRILSREVEGGAHENIYRLHLMSTAEQARDLRIAVTGLDGLQLQSTGKVHLEPTESRTLPVTLRLPANDQAAGNLQFEFVVYAINPEHQQEQVILREGASFHLPATQNEK